MPILVGAQIVAPSIVIPSRPTPAEKLAATWTAPDGSIYQLTDRSVGYWTLANAVAFGAAPLTLTADANPRGGSTMRHVQPESRQIIWPMHIKGATNTEFKARWREIGRAFAMTTQPRSDGTLKPGVLTVRWPDGSTRQISAFYQSGFDGQPGMHWHYDQVVMTLYAEDPYWSDVVQATVTRTFVSDSSTFFAPFLHVSSSQTLGDTTVTNPGDVVAWPTWTITGPATGITATNNDTGESFAVAISLTAGQVLTITTDPPSVIGPTGDSAIGAVNFPDAVLWGLRPGDTSATFDVTGSGAGTSIQLAFFPRYAVG